MWSTILQKQIKLIIPKSLKVKYLMTVLSSNNFLWLINLEDCHGARQ